MNELSGRTNGGGDKPPPPPSPLLTPFPSLFPIPSVASSYPFPPFYFCVLLLTLIHSFSISRSFHFAPPPSSFFDVIFIRPYLLPSSFLLHLPHLSLRSSCLLRLLLLPSLLYFFSFTRFYLFLLLLLSLAPLFPSFLLLPFPLSFSHFSLPPSILPTFLLP